ncbi:hypothetical protein DCAR_0933755 [Daucus carota subsp. sativus]|uniref:Uncharacterized protein n=1 Tax=Daucus carota subsp. sativus TaxID=79200 RepID=A0AAF0XTX6_DAUCS|nr:hypothetical protein DCAR_0933755 [Daucus carota subsp. sativus]
MDKGKEGKKRKVENDGGETEDEKMEKFFALIKSTRQRSSGEGQRRKAEDQYGWCPKFQLEDFEINKFISVPAPADNITGPSTTAEDDQNKQEIVEEENDILNLKLSL